MSTRNSDRRRDHSAVFVTGSSDSLGRTCYGTARRKQISLRDFSLGSISVSRPATTPNEKSFELRKAEATSTSYRRPTLHLLSLSELADLAQTQARSHDSLFAGHNGFNPLRLVDMTDELISKYQQLFLRRSQPQCNAKMPQPPKGVTRRVSAKTFSAALQNKSGRRLAVVRPGCCTYAQTSPMAKCQGRRQKTANPGPEREARTLNAACGVVEACERFLEKRSEMGKRLVSSLGVQEGNRTQVMWLKGRNLRVKAPSKFDTEMKRMRLSAEREKVARAADVTRKFGAAYYTIAQRILGETLSPEKEVCAAMDYFRRVLERGEYFTKAHLQEIIAHLCSRDFSDQLAMYSLCLAEPG